MPPSVSLADVVISDELLSRRIHTVPSRIEIKAMYELANLMVEGTPRLMKRLAQMAIELCNAGSGGISMLEAGDDGDQLFRWRALAGELERYEGGSTPREWSPCGQCLKAAKPMLYSYPARFFTYFQDVATTIVEGLVIPMYANSQPIGTIWIISHEERRNFDAEDVRIMTSLGSFVSATAWPLFGPRTKCAETARVGQEFVWAELIRRIAGGDSSALGALMDETKPAVFARALRILSFRADAEEVTMDVYSHLWTSAASYDPQRAGVLGWLLFLARNGAIDRLRSRARQQESHEALYFQCSSATDFEGFASSSEAKRDVQRALQALPFEQRQAIELAYLSGYSMTEVASRLGSPVGTIKSRIRAGLIALRRLMATTEIHSSPTSQVLDRLRRS
jgi:RNA polymerase sigma factor (sigma-70 family)